MLCLDYAKPLTTLFMRCVQILADCILSLGHVLSSLAGSASEVVLIGKVMQLLFHDKCQCLLYTITAY